MRFLAILSAAIVASAAAAQPEHAWYESNPGIASLLKPDRSLRIGASTNYIRLINPLDVTALAMIAAKSPPITLSVTPAPELASFLTSKTMPVTPEGFEEIRARSKPLLLHTDGGGIEEQTEDLKSFSIHCRFVTQEDADRINSFLSGITAIGRFEAVRSSIPNYFVAVRYLSRYGKPNYYLTLNHELVLIDILSFDRPLVPSSGPQYGPNSIAESAAQALPRVCASALGEVYWRQLSEDIKKDFTTRFEKELRSLPSSVQHPGRKLFTEAFVIAVLYPTTFETKPVGTFAIPGPWPPDPPSGEFLERIRFVDALLDPVESEYMNSLPSRVFEIDLILGPPPTP